MARWGRALGAWVPYSRVAICGKVLGVRELNGNMWGPGMIPLALYCLCVSLYRNVCFQVLSTTETGELLMWDGGLIKVWGGVVGDKMTPF